MSDQRHQIWRCAVCDSTRVYGIGQPDTRTAVIPCGYCQKATMHTFSHIERPDRFTARLGE